MTYNFCSMGKILLLLASCRLGILARDKVSIANFSGLSVIKNKKFITITPCFVAVYPQSQQKDPSRRVDHLVLDLNRTTECDPIRIKRLDCTKAGAKVELFSTSRPNLIK